MNGRIEFRFLAYERSARAAAGRLGYHRRLMPVRLTPVQRLRRGVQSGAVSLVLGAGVSISRGVPMWGELTAHLWKRVMRAPFQPAGHPFELQFALEIICDRLAARHRADFASLLRQAIYGGAARGRPGDTLSILATVLRREQARPVRRVSRVITFNVDDLLEREVHGRRLWKADPIVWPLSRESHSPRRARRPPIPVYHLHGFLPRFPGSYPHAPDTLVFTDAQYWRTVAQPSSFANRVVAHALHDSCCIFIGLSMSDVNLIRWLGLRATAIEADRAAQYPGDPDKIRRATREALQRHFWIRPDSDDRGGMLTPLLDRRGVTAVPIDDWGSGQLRSTLLAAFAA
jgi:hypothetical protein